MMSKAEAQSWIDSIGDDASVAIDDGGLSIIEIDASGKPTGAYLELGGIPEDED